MSHVVVSLLPHRWVSVDYLAGDPAKTLERWRRLPSRQSRLPVAAFPFPDPETFAEHLGVPELPALIRLTDDVAEWVRRSPLVSEWRRAVVGHAARFELAAELLAELAA